MDNNMKCDLAITAILSLSTLILERDPDFTPVPEDDLRKMTLLDLEKVRRTYHELAYAPPGRGH